MKIAFVLILILVSTLAWSSPAEEKNSNPSREISSLKIRNSHARQLLGVRYKNTLSKISQLKNLKQNVFATVTARLPKQHSHLASALTSAIIAEAKKHKFDPYFVMAVISGESSFNPDALGPVGEIGLMQIRPSTGEWMAGRIKLKWRGEKSLKNPFNNIKLGTAYLAFLRDKFDNEGQLYLAAYNMGARSVKRALDKNIRPKDYTLHVMKRYIAFYKEETSKL